MKRQEVLDAGLFQQLSLAGQQLDAARGGRLGWVVSFARDDPKGWTSGDWEAHSYRLLAFAGFGGKGWMLHGVGPLARRDVAALHASVNATLCELVSVPAGRPVGLPTDGLRVALVRATAPGVKPAVYGISRGGPFITMFWQAFADLVFRDGSRLLACRHCGKPILALRKALFCPDSKCAQQYHDREKVKARKNGGSK